MKELVRTPLELIRQKEIEEQMIKKKVDSIGKTPDEIYKTTDQESVSVEELKELKDAQLNYLCEQSILDGFMYTIDSDNKEYKFSYDTEAQLNFIGATSLITSGAVTEIKWTAYNQEGEVVRVKLLASDFQKLTQVMMLHKETNVSKYRDVLMPKLLKATTKKQVDAVVWE